MPGAAAALGGPARFFPQSPGLRPHGEPFPPPSVPDPARSLGSHGGCLQGPPGRPAPRRTGSDTTSARHRSRRLTATRRPSSTWGVALEGAPGLSGELDSAGRFAVRFPEMGPVGRRGQPAERADWRPAVEQAACVGESRGRLRQAGLLALLGVASGHRSVTSTERVLVLSRVPPASPRPPSAGLGSPPASHCRLLGAAPGHTLLCVPK